MELMTLIEVLEKSVEKNGEKPLTNKWLLNILKKTEEVVFKRNEETDLTGTFDPNWD